MRRPLWLALSLLALCWLAIPCYVHAVSEGAERQQPTAEARSDSLPIRVTGFLPPEQPTSPPLLPTAYSPHRSLEEPFEYSDMLNALPSTPQLRPLTFLPEEEEEAPHIDADWPLLDLSHREATAELSRLYRLMVLIRPNAPSIFLKLFASKTETQLYGVPVGDHLLLLQNSDWAVHRRFSESLSVDEYYLSATDLSLTVWVQFLALFLKGAAPHSSPMTLEEGEGPFLLPSAKAVTLVLAKDLLKVPILQWWLHATFRWMGASVLNIHLVDAPDIVQLRWTSLSLHRYAGNAIPSGFYRLEVIGRSDLSFSEETQIMLLHWAQTLGSVLHELFFFAQHRETRSIKEGKQSLSADEILSPLPLTVLPPKAATPASNVTTYHLSTTLSSLFYTQDRWRWTSLFSPFRQSLSKGANQFLKPTVFPIVSRHVSRVTFVVLGRPCLAYLMAKIMHRLSAFTAARSRNAHLFFQVRLLLIGSDAVRAPQDAWHVVQKVWQRAFGQALKAARVEGIRIHGPRDYGLTLANALIGGSWDVAAAKKHVSFYTRLANQPPPWQEIERMGFFVNLQIPSDGRRSDRGHQDRLRALMYNSHRALGSFVIRPPSPRLAFAVHTMTYMGKDTGRILELHSSEASPDLDVTDMPLHPFYNYIFICASGAHVHDWFPRIMEYINANYYEGVFSPFNTQESSERACRINTAPGR